jgi:hypothetical protein
LLDFEAAIAAALVAFDVNRQQGFGFGFEGVVCAARVFL